MARRLPSLNALRAFEAAGRLGLMKLAAGELHVTHSAISRQIQHLEKTLDVRLFEGPKHAPKLTEAGKTILPALTAAFDQLDTAVRMVSDTEEGSLDVSCLGTFMMRWLIPRLHRFKKEHPNIEIRMSTADTPVDFSRENFDLAIRVGSGPWPEDSEQAPLFTEWFGPVCAPTFKVDPSSIHQFPLLQTQTRRSAWTDWSERARIPVDSSRSNEFEHFYFMLEAAVAGLGLCIAPWPLVADDIVAGRLIAPFGFVESGQSYVALRRRQKNKKVSAFTLWLQNSSEEFSQPTNMSIRHLSKDSREATSISLASK